LLGAGTVRKAGRPDGERRHRRYRRRGDHREGRHRCRRSQRRRLTRMAKVIEKAQQEKESLISGSEAIAVACKLADVDVITAYPIRPYDTVMQYVAKLVAKGGRVLLHGAIACDGAFLTHSQSMVKIPPQEWVNAFLPPYNRGDLLLHPDNPITVAPQVNEDWLMELRKHNDEAMKRAKTAVIPEAYRDFERIFNRAYGNPFFEEYQTEDADVVLVGMGTLSMPVKVAIRQMRKEGKKVGFVRVSWFGPFPAEEL